MSSTRRWRPSPVPLLAALALLSVDFGIGRAQSWAQAPYPASGLSLPDAVETARRSNPGYLSVRNDADVAAWEVRSAYGSLLPSLQATSSVSWQGPGEQRFGSLTTDQLGFQDQPSFYFSSFGLGLAYTVNGSILTAPNRARADRDAATARIRGEEANLVRAVTGAYLEVLRRQEELRVLRQRLERGRANLRLAEGRRQVGAATELDVGRARVEVGRARVEVLRGENGTRTRPSPSPRMGVSLPPGQASPRLTTEFQLLEPTWTEDGLYAEALEHNADLEALRASDRAARSRLTAARSAYAPSLSIQAGLGGFTRQASDASYFVAQRREQARQQFQSCQALNELFGRLADPLPPQDCSQFELSDGEVSAIVKGNDRFPFDFTGLPAQASLTLSVPIFQGFGRQRDVEAARVEREDALYRIRDQELALRTDIASGLAAMRTAYETTRIEAENQAVADEQLRLARERYRIGQIPFVGLVEAETVKAEADRERVTALYGYHDALANLEAVVGRSLRPSNGGEP